MKGICPKSNNNMKYIYLGSNDEEHYYVLPDGRICSACKTFFTEPFDAEDDQFTEEQLKTARVSQLNLSFIRFLKDFESKLHALPAYTSPKDPDVTLGGTSRIWYQGRVTIDNENYKLEVSKKAKIPSIKSFIEGLYEGKRPGIKLKRKTKKVLGIVEEDEVKIDPDLHIYASV